MYIYIYIYIYIYTYSIYRTHDLECVYTEIYRWRIARTYTYVCIRSIYHTHNLECVFTSHLCIGQHSKITITLKNTRKSIANSKILENFHQAQKYSKICFLPSRSNILKNCHLARNYSKICFLPSRSLWREPPRSRRQRASPTWLVADRHVRVSEPVACMYVYMRACIYMS
jgi:hypothetical protein